VPDAIQAPGRVNLIGDHTDYQDGLVLPIAIDRGCVVALEPGRDGLVRASSREIAGDVVCHADGRDDPTRVDPPWGRFVAGAVQALTVRHVDVVPAQLAISSSLPVGSGLSSSSALSVALVLALATLSGAELSVPDAARAALDAEVRATGVRGGLMDQTASLSGVAGHALLIDCRDLSVEPIPLPEDVVVLVAHCGVPRALVGTEYSARRAATERAAASLGVHTLRDASPEQVSHDRYARHVVSENARVARFAGSLRTGDIDALGQLLVESHASLRDDFGVSTPELDALVDAFVDAGALGARLTGAGFGGCVVALTTRDRADQVVAATARGFEARTGIATEPFAVEAVDGAGPTSSRAARPSSSRTPPP
jgi:galactokinase